MPSMLSRRDRAATNGLRLPNGGRLVTVAGNFPTKVDDFAVTFAESTEEQLEQTTRDYLWLARSKDHAVYAHAREPGEEG